MLGVGDEDALERGVAVLGVGDEDALERGELLDQRVRALVWLLLEDNEVVASVDLDVAAVASRELGDQGLQAGRVGRHPRAGEELLPV